MSVAKSGKPIRIVDRLLWLIIAFLTLFMFFGVAVGYTQGAGLIRIVLTIAVVLLALVVLGLIFHWGPTVPCMFLGIVLTSSLTSPVSNSYEEAVFNQLGVPLIGTVFGAVGGFLWDVLRRPNSRTLADESRLD